MAKSAQQKQFDEFMKLRYRVLVENHGDEFLLRIPELSLIARHPDLEKGYKALEQKKVDYFRDMIDCGAEDEIPLPPKNGFSHPFLFEIKVFATKLAIVGTIFIIAVGAVGLKLKRLSPSDSIKSAVGSSFDKLERALALASPQEKQDRQEKMHSIMTELRPLIHEVQAGFSSTHEPPSKKGH